MPLRASWEPVEASCVPLRSLDEPLRAFGRPPRLFFASAGQPGLARGFREAGVHDAAFAGDNAFAFEHLTEGIEELVAAVGLDALLEVPERFGVSANAQSEEGLKTSAVEDLLLGGICSK